jgi:hypothetical protein
MYYLMPGIDVWLKMSIVCSLGLFVNEGKVLTKPDTSGKSGLQDYADAKEHDTKETQSSC